MSPTSKADWKEKAAKKQKSILDSILPEWRSPSIKDDMAAANYTNTYEYLNSVLPADEVEVTDSSLLQLQKKITSKQWSAVKVVHAFCHRAALAHQILNCCSDIFFGEALKQAEELDQYLKETGKTKGPLHGIPVSLKDQIDLVGKDSTLGYTANAESPKLKNSLLADILLLHGAVFYVKTTVPISLMLSETESNLFGYTWNSVNINMTSGGSSGGEGSLIGAGASVLGFGTDIGGSIRIPSCFQGLYGIKPSNGRFTYMNVTNSLSGQESVSSAIGPMGRHLEDIKYVSKLLVDAEAWHYDPKVLQKPWAEVHQEKFTIGVWHFEKSIMPHPPILRAVKELKDALIADGHDVVDIDVPMLDDIIKAVYKVYYADAGKEFRDDAAKSGEPVIEELEKFLANSMYKSPVLVNEWFELCNEVYKVRQKFLQYWQDTRDITSSKKPIDAIVCPIWPSAAFPKNGPQSDKYCAIFNLLDSACVTVPVTTVDKAKDPKDTSYNPGNEEEKAVYDMYDPDFFHGMPVVLQVAARKLEEEKALAIASACEKALKNTKDQ